MTYAEQKIIDDLKAENSEIKARLSKLEGAFKVLDQRILNALNVARQKGLIPVA